MISICALGVIAAGCDTGDGKQLKPYDPADYPAPVVETTIAEDTIAEDLGSELVVDPTVGADLGVPVEPFSLAAPWLDGGDIDPRHTCDGLNVSPALSWGAVPEGTVEIAISLVDDSAVSNGEPFVHWVIGGLDPSEIAVVEGDVPATAVQALNFFGDVGYGGPCPPVGDEPHLYRLTAYALNQRLELADGVPAAEFLDVIATQMVASVDVTGFYQR
jgi:Raf kinase inhibitor-like YbhB/YbcL family protein